MKRNKKRRKYTQEQIDAMNRELELRGATYRVVRDADGRGLTRQEVMMWW